MTSYRLPNRGRVDHAKPVRFTFDGKAYQGLAGDTLASALLANGVHLMGRSFKYHRPRGPVSAGSDEPNALITYNTGSKEIGLIFGRGKKTTTAGIMEGEPSPCSGKTDVAAKLVSGHYVCKGVTSYDPATGRMGTVDIEITFTAKS